MRTSTYSPVLAAQILVLDGARLGRHAREPRLARGDGGGATSAIWRPRSSVSDALSRKLLSRKLHPHQFLGAGNTKSCRAGDVVEMIGLEVMERFMDQVRAVERSSSRANGFRRPPSIPRSVSPSTMGRGSARRCSRLARIPMPSMAANPHPAHCAAHHAVPGPIQHEGLSRAAHYPARNVRSAHRARRWSVASCSRLARLCGRRNAMTTNPTSSLAARAGAVGGSHGHGSSGRECPTLPADCLADNSPGGSHAHHRQVAIQTLRQASHRTFHRRRPAPISMRSHEKLLPFAIAALFFCRCRPAGGSMSARSRVTTT